MFLHTFLLLNRDLYPPYSLWQRRKGQHSEKPIGGRLTTFPPLHLPTCLYATQSSSPTVLNLALDSDWPWPRCTEQKWLRHIQGCSWKSREVTYVLAHRAMCYLAGGLSGWGYQTSGDWFPKPGSGWQREHNISTHVAPMPLVTAMPVLRYRSPKQSRGQNKKYSRSVSNNSV